MLNRKAVTAALRLTSFCDENSCATDQTDSRECSVAIKTRAFITISTTSDSEWPTREMNCWILVYHMCDGTLLSAPFTVLFSVDWKSASGVEARCVALKARADRLVDEDRDEFVPFSWLNSNHSVRRRGID